ncbi:MAG: WYL domain-containing protein [Polyangiaceae bacterium]|nr:WYL domain-containing protein [Polyangiaceae bacterium]
MPQALGRPKGRFTQHRRLDVLRDLLSRYPKGLTLYDLAHQLDVTPRTMRRYLNEFRHDFELEQFPTRGGGPLLWRVRAGEIPRKVELRRTQAYAFLAARRVFEPLRGSTLFDEIDMAVQKLVTFAHRPGRGPNAGPADAQLERRFVYLPHAPKDYSQKTDELDELFQAVSDLKPLVTLYRSSGKAREERITIHPYALVLHRDSIYCVGYHVDRSEVRTFLLDRMRNSHSIVTERFTLPEGFSIDDYFQGEFGVWRAEERRRVVVDFDAHAAEFVRMRRVHATQRLASLPGGGVRLTMTIGSLHQVTSWVLEWGPHATVIEPPELVERVTTELAGALANYPTSVTRRVRAPSTADARPPKGQVESPRKERRAALRRAASR